jgi:hypothetical protein
MPSATADGGVSGRMTAPTEIRRASRRSQPLTPEPPRRNTPLDGLKHRFNALIE